MNPDSSSSSRCPSCNAAKALSKFARHQLTGRARETKPADLRKSEHNPCTEASENDRHLEATPPWLCEPAVLAHARSCTPAFLRTQHFKNQGPRLIIFSSPHDEASA